jgi:hypothetical protein
MQFPLKAAVVSLVLAWFASALLDPVYVLDLTAIQIARLVTVGIIITAGFSAAALGRPRDWSMIGLLRVASLLGIAALTWIRDGVPPDNPTIGFVLSRLVMFLAAGVALRAGLSASAQEQFRRVCTRPGPEVLAKLSVVAVVLPILIAAPLIAHRWDTSGWMDSHGYDSYAMNILTGKIPAGNSQYMPLYQYGLAFIYYVFGHFFFIQQCVNVVLAAAGIVALSLAVWVLFESTTAVVAAMVLAVFSRQFYYAVYFTQIESWYVPLICILLLVWARYWRAPTWTRLVGLAVMIALGVNTRNQGAAFFAFMCTTPLWGPGLPWRQRWVQCIAISGLVALSLVPWTVRNYIVESRLSPSGSRSSLYIGVLSDHRVGLYGIRYWEGWDDVVAEFEQRYANPADRERAYVEAAWANLTSDPAWLGRALLWRTAAFYGVLPDTWLEIARIVPIDWRDEWRRYVFGRSTQLVLLPLSLLGFLWRPGRTSLFLMGAILSNILILIVSATSEDRISYPLLPMHLLLAAGIFAERAPLIATVPTVTLPRRTWIIAGLSVFLFLTACRVWIGSRHTYRTLMERGVAIVPSPAVDDSLVKLNDYVRSAKVASNDLHVGQRVRLRALLSNYMLPPKFAGIVTWLPSFASEPLRETYFYSYLLNGDLPGTAGEWIGVTFLGAQLSEAVREGDAVDIEGMLVHIPTAEAQGYFVRADVVHRLPIDSSMLPPFP